MDHAPLSIDRHGRAGESSAWVQALSGSGVRRDEAVARLHGLLERAARFELTRRGGGRSGDLENLATEVADDALMAIMRKLPSYRGDSRFTTWAYKFAVFQVGVKTGRHFWLNPPAALDATAWDRLPDRLGMGPAQATELRELVAALRRAVDDELSEQQRRIFLAVVLGGALIDTVAAELDTTRNAVYKSLFDARRKLRRALDREGFRSTVGGEA
jgi:RNA polymerase sigma-70 factor (ECF subfamily)